MKKSFRSSLPQTPRLNEVTRTFGAPVHTCTRCHLVEVKGKLRCDACVDDLRRGKALTEVRFLISSGDALLVLRELLKAAQRAR